MMKTERAGAPSPTEPFGQLAEQFKKPVAIGVPAEEGTALVAPEGDLKAAFGQLHSQRSAHAGNSIRKAAALKPYC